MVLERVADAALTPLLLHLSTLEALVQQSDAQPHVHRHPLLIHQARHTILHQDIRTVGT